MTAVELYRESARRGLRLEPRGDKLAVIPRNRVPRDFAEVLRRHKQELLDWLETRNSNLTQDCLPWLHIARQVLDGEFDDAGYSTVESLAIGLRGIEHPTCKLALNKLKN
jgi:hypothetical protein